jgi:hypothetical protein
MAWATRMGMRTRVPQAPPTVSACAGLNSMRMALRCSLSATSPVVPAPPNISSTVPPSGQPAMMQVFANSVGIIA